MKPIDAVLRGAACLAVLIACAGTAAYAGQAADARTVAAYEAQIAALAPSPAACASKSPTHLCYGENLPFLMIHRPGQRAARSILMIHGLGDSPYSMKALADLFYSYGYNVVAVLLPGHGRKASDLLHVKLKEWQQAAAQGLQVAEAVGRRVSIAGFSTGGALTLNLVRRNYASAHPLDLQDLFLFSPAIQIHDRKAPVICGLSPLDLAAFEAVRPWASVAPWAKAAAAGGGPYQNYYNGRYAKLALNGVCQLQEQIEENSATGRLPRLPVGIGLPDVTPALIASLARYKSTVRVSPEIISDIESRGLGVFAVESDSDTTVNPNAVIQFMRDLSGARAQFILYPEADGIAHADVTRPDSPTNNAAHFAQLTNGLAKFLSDEAARSVAGFSRPARLNKSPSLDSLALSPSFDGRP
ncbi:MAG TPA: alpha/beta fold hydrolase [Elusimicrobiota bacterium]|nr:alpha/beta fold hydrolase [Elusimicrobiota bacterium]